VNIFGIGLPEMALIMILALLVFGPKKLPEIGRSLGKTIRGFQDASKEFETAFKTEAEQIEQAVKTPMSAVLESPEQPALSASTAAVTPAPEPLAEVVSEPAADSVTAPASETT
jgi:sec-independent protein translocase protein TatA